MRVEKHTDNHSHTPPPPPPAKRRWTSWKTPLNWDIFTSNISQRYRAVLCSFPKRGSTSYFIWALTTSQAQIKVKIKGNDNYSSRTKHLKIKNKSKTCTMNLSVKPSTCSSTRILTFSTVVTRLGLDLNFTKSWFIAQHFLRTRHNFYYYYRAYEDVSSLILKMLNKVPLGH